MAFATQLSSHGDWHVSFTRPALVWAVAGLTGDTLVDWIVRRDKPVQVLADGVARLIVGAIDVARPADVALSVLINIRNGSRMVRLVPRVVNF